MTTFIKSGLLLSATLIFAACGGGGGSSPSVVVSSAPVFTSPSSVMVQENTLTGFYLVSASDPNNDPLTFTLSGGADLSQFTLASDNQLTFITPPDFENPSDAGGNNVYEVEFAVNDGNNNPVTMLVSITVTDQAQEPVRNKDISFQNVAVTRDVLFKTVGATELRMDIFSPEGDTDTSRPVMIAAFGGGFIAGNRFNEDDSVRIARDFARRGYVAAAIDYRTAATGTPTEDELLRAIMIALQDAWAAVRFFREDANGPNIYGTNPNQIFVGGQSAGGVIGKNLAILDESDTETVSRFSSFIGSGGLYGDGATYDESRIQGALRMLNMMKFSKAQLIFSMRIL